MLVVLLLLLLTGCALAKNTSAIQTPVPDFLDPASPIAAKQASLSWIFLGLSAVVFVVVEGLLLYNYFHHVKKREDEGEMPPQTYRDYTIEIIYTRMPILLVISF